MIFKQMQYFISIVKNNSFIEAAEENYISQSAISQAIKSLEDELGVKLLERKNRGFTLIGSPIYWGTMPMSMFTQLEKLDFTGKIIKIFTTHEGSGLGTVVSDVKKICKGATILDSLAIQGSMVYDAKGRVQDWIK